MNLHGSTLAGSPDWHGLKLVRMLDAHYGSALERVYRFVLPLTKALPLGAEEYTDHGLSHGARVAERIGKILPEDVKLNQPELYIVLLGALLHDLGMWIPRQEALAAFDDPEFLQFCNRHYPHEAQEVQRALNVPERRWMGELGAQRLAAAWARVHHPKRFAELLLSSIPDGQHEALRTLIDPAFLLPVALIVEAHGWQRARLLEDPDLEPREIGGILVNLRYLAELLRLGDLLDLGEGRVSELLWRYLWPLNSVSEAHWRKEAALRLDRCEPDLIVVSGTFDIDRDGIAAAEAFRLASEWLDWLQEEIDGGAALLERRMSPDLAGRYRFGRLQLRREGVKAKGLVLGGSVSFELDRDRILELLGEEIYAEGPIFCRELLQNAIDATRAQMLRDHPGTEGNPTMPRDAPWLWPAAITADPRYAIEVTTGSETVNGCRLDTYEVRDRGIGMTLQQLRDYLLQIGRSFYRTPSFQKEFSHPSISRFGIGFVSCLVAEEISLTTRSRGEPAGLQLTLKRPSTQFSVTRAPEAEFGTVVKLWIDPERAKESGWRTPPYAKSSRAVTFREAEDNSASPYATATRQWGLWPEMPVQVDAKPWGPRRVGSDAHVLERVGMPSGVRDVRWFPFLLRSSTGKPVGEATFGIETIAGNRLPWFPGYLASFASSSARSISIRGIWASHERLSGDPLQLHVNFFRVPPRSLTAARALRSSVIPRLAAQLVETAALTIAHHTTERLRAIDPLCAAFWRLSVDIHDTKVLPPLILPFRTKSQTGWASEDELLQKFDRFVLVPMMVAINGPWTLDVPCVGYSYQRVHQKLVALRSCKLVVIDGLCTGVLYPPYARMEGLQPFLGNATRTPIGTYTWEEAAPFRTIGDGDGQWQPEHLIEGALPEYDRGRDRWRDENRFPSQPEFMESMRQRLASLPPIDYPPDLLDYTLDDPCTDWE